MKKIVLDFLDFPLCLSTFKLYCTSGQKQGFQTSKPWLEPPGQTPRLGLPEFGPQDKAINSRSPDSVLQGPQSEPFGQIDKQRKYYLYVLHDIAAQGCCQLTVCNATNKGRHPANNCKISQIFLNLLEFTWIRVFQETPDGSTDLQTDGWTDGQSLLYYSYRVAFHN